MSTRPNKASKEAEPSLAALRFACAQHLDKHRRTLVLEWVKQLRSRLNLPTSSNLPDPSYTALTYRSLDVLFRKLLAALRENDLRRVVPEFVANHHEVLEHERSLKPLLVKLDTLGMLIRRSIIADPTIPSVAALYLFDRVFSTLQVDALSLFGERRRMALKTLIHQYKNDSQAVGSVLGSCPIGILVTDRDGFITHFNEQQEKISGKKAQQALGKRLYHDYAYRNAEEFRRAFERAVARGETAHFSRRLYKSSTGAQYLDVTLAPVKDEYGQITGVVQMLEDVTARVDLESQLRNQNRALTTRLSELQEAYTYIGRINRQFASLVDINATLSSRLSLDKMLEFIARSAAMLTRARLTTLRLLRGPNLVLNAQFGLDQQAEQRYRTVPIKGSLIGRVLKDTKKILMVDLSEDGGFYWPELKERFGLRQLISVPLRSRGQTIGVLTIHLPEARDFSLHEQNFIIALANQAALAIDLEKNISALRSMQHRSQPRRPANVAPVRGPDIELVSAHAPIRYSEQQADGRQSQ